MTEDTGRPFNEVRRVGNNNKVGGLVEGINRMKAELRVTEGGQQPNHYHQQTSSKGDWVQKLSRRH